MKSPQERKRSRDRIFSMMSFLMGAFVLTTISISCKSSLKIARCMQGDTTEGGATSSTGQGGGTAQAIWQTLPIFDPEAANFSSREWKDKVTFIHSISEPNLRVHLAPRLAMLCKGSAWKQASKVAEQLKDPENGVKALVKALQKWSDLEEQVTMDHYENALYKTVQRSDESVASYTSRLEIAFDELGPETTIKDIQAYVLLRQSSFDAMSKKQLLMLTGGKIQTQKLGLDAGCVSEGKV